MQRPCIRNTLREGIICIKGREEWEIEEQRIKEVYLGIQAVYEKRNSEEDKRDNSLKIKYKK